MSDRQKTGVTRRSFLKWTSAASAMAALPLSRQLHAATPAPAQTTPAAAPAAKGQWKPVACWHNCGGRCVNKALVADGVVVRQKTDDVVADSPDFPQQRGCLRGRSQRKQVFGADRLKYPMKRKNWAPGGGTKPCADVTSGCVSAGMRHWILWPPKPNASPDNTAMNPSGLPAVTVRISRVCSPPPGLYR